MPPNLQYQPMSFGGNFSNDVPIPQSAPVALPNYVPAPLAGGSAPPASPGGGGMWQGFSDWMRSSGMLGSTDTNTGIKTDGWGGLALGAAQGLGSAWLGLQQYSLAKESLAESKRQFGLNYDAQKTTTNSALEDRQRARVASNAGAYQPVGEYMDQNRIR